MTLSPQPHSFLNRLANTLVPNRCPLCQINLVRHTSICHACTQSLPYIHQACRQCGIPLNQNDICGSCLTKPSSIDLTFTPFRYEQPISRLILELKFSTKSRLAGPLANALFQHCHTNPAFGKVDILMPIPMHTKRLLSRGFNQSQLISTALSKLMAIPVDTHSIYRRQASPPQSSLTRKARVKNIRNAFEMNPNTQHPLPYQHVALVDDVITTGSTIQEMAKLLKLHGVKTVSAYAIARA